jgi:hypothetical protein
MAKKETKPTTAAPRKPARKPASRTTTRTRKPAITHEVIAQRAYEIYLSGSAGGPFDDWVRAETELRV